MKPELLTLLERLTWEADAYLKQTGTTYALIDRIVVAEIMNCPAGRAVRLRALPHTTPGWMQICSTNIECVRYVERWLQGMDIVPWDATGVDEPDDRPR